MRLNTFILTLCVCALHARAASIASEKKLDDLDNVDLDNVALEPEVIDQVTVKDVDNNLRKTVVDIPVKIVEEPTVLDENSNDYVPNIDESIKIKRVEIDLDNPGPPQRQEHETQNPENYGEKEKAIFGIKKRIEETEKIFNQGFQELSNNFKNLFGSNEDLPAIQNNLKNLRHTFTDQIVKLDESIKKTLKPDPSQTIKDSEKKLKIVESQLENLQKNFEVGVDTLTEGVEVLTIIREEDDAAKTKSIANEEHEVAKADAESGDKPDNTASSSEAPASSTQSPTNPIMQWLSNFQSGMSTAFANLNTAFQNNVLGSQQSSASQPPTNPIVNFFQGITNPNSNQNPPAGQGQNSVPSGAQSDTAVPPSTAAPWGPQAILQQVQNSWQNFINPSQNAQQPQADTQQPAAQPANGGPLSQAFQNIVQFIQRPNLGNQQPVNPPPSQSTSASTSTAQKPTASQAESVPAQPQQAQEAVQTVPAVEPQRQNGPIQQLVQSNPIIKGIQSAVQRIQGTPNPETPRNEIVMDDNEANENVKGLRPGVNSANQGSIDSTGVVKNIEEQKEENVIPKDTEEILEGSIKAEKMEIPSLSDKTE